MRKVLAGFLTLLMLCAGASAESLPPKLLPESYFLADIQRNYPDWSVRVSTRYGSGRYEGEMAQYAEVSLYRITDEAIELLELTALVNPIREGDDVPWSVHALIPVEIVPGAADTLRAMTAKEIFDYGVGAAFTEAARNLLVPSLRAADETVTQLMSCSRFLFCITENSAGQSILRLAQWDGSGYTNVTATLPQPHLSFNTSHSYNDHMELWVNADDWVYPRYDAEVGWHINHFFINDTNLVVFQNRIIEGEIDEWYQDNKLMGTMQRFTGVDFDFGSRLIPFGRPANTSHLFRCKPVGTYKEIKIVATNPSGRKTTGVIRPNVSVIAHRGGAGLYPENTIEAMLNAVKLGVTDIEMDLHVTKDGVVVVSHDPYVIGYGKKYPIYSLTWKQLTSKVIGNAKDPAFPDSKRLYTHVPMITTLIDSVETYCHLHRLPPVRYTIEIKSDPSADGKLTPDYKTFTDQCIKALGSRNLGARLLLQSFDVRTLKYVHSKYPSARLLYLIDSTSGTYDKAMAVLGFVPYAIGPDYTMVNSAFVSKAKSAGMRVIPYTVDNKADAQKMVKAGVNAIITNYPDKMFGWIK